MRSTWQRVIFAGLLALTLTGCQTLAGGNSETQFANDDDFRSWFAFYYKSPRPEMLTASLRFMKQHKYLDDYPDIASVFLSKVMKDNPKEVNRWVETEWQELGGSEWSVILVSLWMVETDESKELMKRYLDKASADHKERIKGLLDRDPKMIDPLKADIVDPRQVNLVWAAFSATGDERYVQKIIDQVHNYGNPLDETSAAIGEAAIMTLANNALQHDMVAKLCDRMDSNHPDPKTRILLKAMLNALADVVKEQGSGDLPAH